VVVVARGRLRVDLGEEDKALGLLPAVVVVVVVVVVGCKEPGPPPLMRTRRPG
jgi:hypothetical protein